MKILIDADGCPVVDISIKIAAEYNLDCVIICDTSHIFDKTGATTITVSKGNDSVDFALVNTLFPGDVAVTQDYGLAAMCLAKRAVPISQDGMIYTDDNIDALLNMRHMSQKARMSRSKIRGGKTAKRTAKQDEDFAMSLRKLVSHG